MFGVRPLVRCGCGKFTASNAVIYICHLVYFSVALRFSIFLLRLIRFIAHTMIIVWFIASYIRLFVCELEPEPESESVHTHQRSDRLRWVFDFRFIFYFPFGAAAICFTRIEITYTNQNRNAFAFINEKSIRCVYCVCHVMTRQT